MYKNCIAFEVVKKSMFGIEEQSIFANLCSDYSLSVCKQLLQIVIGDLYVSVPWMSLILPKVCWKFDDSRFFFASLFGCCSKASGKIVLFDPA